MVFEGKLVTMRKED